jgi:hypothetical protein
MTHVIDSGVTTTLDKSRKEGRKEGIVLLATYEFLACHRRLLLLLLWIRELMGVVVVVLRMRK